MRASLIAGILAVSLAAQAPTSSQAKITPPKLIHMVNPKFTTAARSAVVQGTTILEMTIDVSGKPTDIQIVSPLGFGLDETAVAAVEQWRYKPCEKDGTPVPVQTTVTVNFRFPQQWFDGALEKRRTRYNTALKDLAHQEPTARAAAKKTILELSKQKFPAAVYLEGKWLREGNELPPDPTQALSLLEYAASKNYGPAIFVVGRMKMEGKELPLDKEQGLREVREASVLGSRQAQFFMGAISELGRDVPKDDTAARRYFRLCAATGEPACQYRLARLLLSASDRNARELVQAVAWLQLAAAGGDAEARKLLDSEIPKLTPEQTASAQSLRPQLVRTQ